MDNAADNFLFKGHEIPDMQGNVHVGPSFIASNHDLQLEARDMVMQFLLNQCLLPPKQLWTIVADSQQSAHAVVPSRVLTTK